MTTDMERDIMSLYKETVNSLVAGADAFSRETFNQVPFKESWTAAQVLVHVTKSNLSVAEVLSWQGKPVHRPPDERIKELGDIFLDFTTRLELLYFVIYHTRRHINQLNNILKYVSTC